MKKERRKKETHGLQKYGPPCAPDLILCPVLLLTCNTQAQRQTHCYNDKHVLLHHRCLTEKKNKSHGMPLFQMSHDGMKVHSIAAERPYKTQYWWIWTLSRDGGLSSTTKMRPLEMLAHVVRVFAQ